MPVVPKPESIRAFKTEKALEMWMKTHHVRKSEIYIRIYKKDTSIPSVTYAQALDIALCFGWIDGIRKPFDEVSFLQRFTPRKPKSRWSRINRDHVARLCAAGRMTVAGQRQIDAARADGRWDAAYASQSNLEIPPDLAAAIRAEPKALEAFRRLNRQNVYALAYRTLHIKTPSIRERRIREYVEMLKRGESLHPNGPPKTRGKKASVIEGKANAKTQTSAPKRVPKRLVRDRAQV